MKQVTFYNRYYKTQPIAINTFDKSEVLANSKVLNSYGELSEQFNNLKIAHYTKLAEVNYITVGVLPNQEGLIDNIIEISVEHKYKKRLFSKAAEDNYLSLGLIKGPEDRMEIYELKTNDFSLVEKVFNDYIINHKGPDLSIWKRYY